ncbi:MAG: sigma 54-interacting transcriptional regulator [Sulfuricaulis sp.]|uniref:sigma-54 interaction domain-containing protein n=1 Tax=Sulfuricaulis sp. TaxID=2003553 RepID=UPI003C3BD6E6
MNKPAIDVHSLINAQDSPAVIIDENYRIVAANQAYCTSYGIDPDKVVNHRCHEVSHHSAVPCHMNGEDCPHKQVFSTDKPFEVLHTHYDYANRPDRVRIKAHPLHDPNGDRYLLEVINRLAPSTNLSCEDMQMVGHSPAFLALIENLIVAAKSDAAVLIYGESGTGKELAAKFVHDQSARKKNPYVELNCAAIPEALCESELFGHERGAFTGCAGLKQGLFELADSGTLFLDEIGELPLPMQAKLLRVLDSGEFRRLGGNKLTKVDVRVIAATNRNLMAMVTQGKFREDLYFRIAGINVSIPPLRERRTDIPALAEILIKRLCKPEHNLCRLTHAAIERLVSYSFPGNIRELQNILQKALATCDCNIIDAKHIHFNEHHGINHAAADSTHDHAHGKVGGVMPADGSKLSIAEVERHYISTLLEQHDGNRRIVANIMGINERTLYRKLKRYELRTENV